MCPPFKMKHLVAGRENRIFLTQRLLCSFQAIHTGQHLWPTDLSLAGFFKKGGGNHLETVPIITNHFKQLEYTFGKNFEQMHIFCWNSCHFAAVHALITDSPPPPPYEL